MFRATMMAMTIGAILAAASVEAGTPGPVCKAECAPRIERDCGALRGKAFKRCRRGFVRACRQTTPETACRLEATGFGGPGDGGDQGGGDQGDAVQAVTDLLKDKHVTTERSDFFASGSITTTRDMQLCSSGGVLFVETQITSTTGLGDFDNTFDDTQTFTGTWTIQLVGGAPVLALDLGEAAGPRQLAVTQNDQGQLFVDGDPASIEDASGPCSGAPGDGGTPGDPGTPDPAQQIADALVGHELVVEETNIGFGRRTTTVALCDSTRYVGTVITEAAPGFVRQIAGAWSIEITAEGADLVLTNDDGTVIRFTIGIDAEGGLLLNGFTVFEGDPTTAPVVCA